MKLPNRAGRARLRRPMNLSPFALLAAVPTLTAIAQDAADGRAEQVVVVGERVYPIVDSVTPHAETAVDTAELLRQLEMAR